MLDNRQGKKQVRNLDEIVKRTAHFIAILNIEVARERIMHGIANVAIIDTVCLFHLYSDDAGRDEVYSVGETLLVPKGVKGKWTSATHVAKIYAVVT